MSIFSTREKSIRALEQDLSDEAAIIEELFVCLDEMIERLYSIDQPFARVCALTLLKARYRNLAIYSLTLDGLAQEAGAILRPLIGNIEKLPYFRMSDDHVEKALSENLPSEGKIAKKIDGGFQELRNYLSMYSSHSTISLESHKHLVNFKTGKLIIQQEFIEKTFRKNMEMVFSFLTIALNEGYLCLEHAGNPDDDLLSYINDVRSRGIDIIHLD